MTLKAAMLLDDAFALYLQVASVPDGSAISFQSPSWENPSTPYDFAAALCRSLIPHAYNFSVTDTAATQWIWDQIIDSLEVIDLEYVNQYFLERRQVST